MWRRDLTELLEPALAQHPERPFGVNDVPFAVLCYPPEDEFDLRAAIRSLIMRLEAKGKSCLRVSLARLMFDSLLSQAGIDEWAAVERESGWEDLLDTIPQILKEEAPLADRVETLAKKVDYDRGIIFLEHAGALFPFFRTSSLLSQLEGKIRTPLVLLYPGRKKGEFGLQFMGKAEAEHSYRAAIYGG